MPSINRRFQMEREFYQWEDVCRRASGLWPDILSAYGIPFAHKQKNLPCPVCGGNDRAHYKHQDGKVLLHCRQAIGHEPNMWGDELLLELAFGGDFASMATELGRYVGAQPEERKKEVRRKAVIAEASSGIHKAEDCKVYAEKVMGKASMVDSCALTRRYGVSPPVLLTLKDGRVVCPMYIDGVLLDAVVIDEHRNHQSVSLLYHVPGPGCVTQARHTIGDPHESAMTFVGVDYFDLCHMRHKSQAPTAAYLYADWNSANADASRLRKSESPVMLLCSALDMQAMDEACCLLSKLGARAKLLSPVPPDKNFTTMTGEAYVMKEFPYLMNSRQADQVWTASYA